ncbi:MAG: hypothetical protein Q9192_000976 [Flavoplaca navasiana]
MFETLARSQMQKRQELHGAGGDASLIDINASPGPNEITIFHPAAVEIFDAPKNKTIRTDWYDLLHPRTSSIFTRNEEEHSARRRIWSHAMSTKGPQANIEETDIASWFIDDFAKSKSTKSHKDRQNLLSGNTVTAMVAGSDTTRPSLICIWYALAKYPYHADKIYEELITCNLDDINALASIPHLEAVINETLRLWPPQMTGGNRMTSDQGLWIDDTWIPGNTKVAAPKYSIMRREFFLLPVPIVSVYHHHIHSDQKADKPTSIVEAAFQDPTSFLPERWTSRPEMNLDRRAFAPFGVVNLPTHPQPLANPNTELQVTGNA